MVINYKILGERIQAVRKTRGIKQYALAEKTGLSCQYISQIETGKKQISLQSLMQIAEALDVTADSLLVGNQKETTTEYDYDLCAIISGCNYYEKKIVCGIASETRRLLMDNRFFRN